MKLEIDYSKDSLLDEFSLRTLEERYMVGDEKSPQEAFARAAIAFAALLLIIPGFATDVIGFLLIFPISRRYFFNKISKRFKPKESKKNNFIDGDFEDIEDDNDRKI